MAITRLKVPGWYETLDVSSIDTIYLTDGVVGGNNLKNSKMVVVFKSGKEASFQCKDAESASKVFTTVQEAMLALNTGSSMKGNKNMLTDIIADLKGYMRTNKDLIYTVLFLIVLDHVIFDGAFRERLKALVEGLLKKVEDKVTPTTVEGTVTAKE